MGAFGGGAAAVATIERMVATIKTFGEIDERSLRQLRTCMEAGDAEFGVLCADHHPGYSQPIGGGIAYEGYVSPSGVGYDIGCGNKAVQTDMRSADLDVEAVMREITRRISFGMGVPNRERVDDPVVEKILRADFAPQRKLHQLARTQLGTVGSGNHFVNLFEDEEGIVWVGVHRVRLPGARPGARVRGARARGRDGLAAGALPGRIGARPGVRRGDGACGRVRVRGT